MKSKILCVPFDPVHDVGIKIIKSELDKQGYSTVLLPPDLSPEAIVKKATSDNYNFIFVSRTLGYGIAELLAKLVDMFDAAGVRDNAKIVLGGKAITPELAAELGFDKGFSEHSSIEEIVAFIEGKKISTEFHGLNRVKKDFCSKYDYKFNNSKIENLLSTIVEKTLNWAKNKSSAGIERAKIKEQILIERASASNSNKHIEELVKNYFNYADPEFKEFYSSGKLLKGVRQVSKKELNALNYFLETCNPFNPVKIQHNEKQPLIFKFLGSGCPVMDLTHAKICERYGVDGFLIINPSWEARYEGLLEGLLTHENDGTITSLENIDLLRNSLDKSSLLTVRAHRGLNTPETILLAGMAKADMAKINLVYGSLGAGTDPERLAVDGIYAINLASRFNMPFDIPGNDELSGVPAWKSLAGLLINVMLGIKLNAKPILKPLFCYGPHIVINGLMKLNYIDYNAAKIMALKSIVNSPIWPGEPIAFMTQTEERVQSANATSYHASLAAGLGVDAITIASTDEAYSRGPICITSRIDSINAVHDAFRFVGDSSFATTNQAVEYSEMLVEKITSTLEEVEKMPNLPDAISKGLLGNQEDGAYPGTFGKNTLINLS